MSALIRIGLRYGAGLLIMHGYLRPEDGAMISDDPELIAAMEIGLGMVAAVAAELWYWAAKRLGWRT